LKEVIVMNRTEIIESVVAGQLKPKGEIPTCSVGDTVDVHYRIIEGDKERIQIFQGVFIAERGRGVN
jgi:large subunit ribosomal protein L19